MPRNTATVVRIVKVLTDRDMRKKHELREGRLANKLRPGEVLLAFNRRRTMARFIDAAGGVHDYYVESGRFSVDTLKKEVRAGLFIELRIGRDEQKKVVRLGLAA